MCSSDILFVAPTVLHVYLNNVKYEIVIQPCGSTLDKLTE